MLDGNRRISAPGAGHGNGMDAGTLSKPYAVEGPFVTIYRSTRGDTEDAAVQLETRWRNILRDLANEGIDEANRDALSLARADHTQGGTRVLVAAHGSVHLAVSLADMGVDTSYAAPLDELPLRAAWGTGADVAFVSGGGRQSPDDGVGALLRYAD